MVVYRVIEENKKLWVGRGIIFPRKFGESFNAFKMYLNIEH